MVTSSFTGIDLVLFGAIEPMRRPAARAAATTSSSPSPGRARRWCTRRKERVLGIWTNVEFADLRQRAGLSRGAVATGRSTQIATADTLRRLQLGLDNVPLPQRVGADIADVVRRRSVPHGLHPAETEHGLYGEKPNARDLPHADPVPRRRSRCRPRCRSAPTRST